MSFREKEEGMYVPRGMYIFTRKMKKIVALGLTLVLTLGLVACGNDKTSDSNDGSKEDNVGIVEDISSGNEYSEELSAFKEFYNQYCEEHYCELEHFIEDEVDGKVISMDEVPYYDCVAKLELCNDELVLIIADVVSYKKVEDAESEEVRPVFDVLIYKCVDKRVEEIARIKEIATYDIRVFNMGNACVVDDNYGESYVVQISDGTIEIVDENSDDTYQDVYYYETFLDRLVYKTALYPGISGERFSSCLEYLRTQEFGNSFDLDLVFARYLVENHICFWYADEWNQIFYDTLGYETEGFIDVDSCINIEISYYEDGIVYRYFDSELVLGKEEYLSSEEYKEKKDNSEDEYLVDKTFVVYGADDGKEIPQDVLGVDVSGWYMTSAIYSECSNIFTAIQSTFTHEEVWDSMASYQGEIISFEKFDELPENFKSYFVSYYGGEVPTVLINDWVYAFKWDGNVPTIYIASSDLSVMYEKLPNSEVNFISFK